MMTIGISKIRPHVTDQFAQFILKIGSALAVRVGWGEVGGNALSPCRHFRQFHSRGVLSDQRALTIECSLMSRCHELVKDMWNKLWLKFPGLTHSKSGNTGEKKCVENTIQ